MSEFIYRLEQGLEGSLPGRPAQFEMARSLRHGQLPVPDDAVPAGVLALLSRPGSLGEWAVTYIRRTDLYHKDRHSGQISFPGGKKERKDPDLAHTALRETEEEIGVPKEQVRLLGNLTELYIPVSNFLVHPYVGLLESEVSFRKEEKEVKEVFQVPLSTLLHPDTVRAMDMEIHMGHVLREVPYFDLDGKVLWGATAMITNELLTIIRRIGLQKAV